MRFHEQSDRPRLERLDRRRATLVTLVASLSILFVVAAGAGRDSSRGPAQGLRVEVGFVSSEWRLSVDRGLVIALAPRQCLPGGAGCPLIAWGTAEGRLAKADETPEADSKSAGAGRETLARIR